MGSILFPGLITTVLFFFVIFFVLLRNVSKKNHSDTGVNYTPFDYITGQTDKEFHEEEKQKDDEND